MVKHYFKKMDKEEQRLWIVTLILAIFVSVGILGMMIDGVITIKA